jgi:hypothetical protein
MQPTMLQEIGQFTKAVVDIFTVAGILFAVWKGLQELRRQREQRHDELVVRKMEIAQKLLEEFSKDSRAQCATQMFDWTGREYEIAAEKKVQIHWHEVKTALRIHDENTAFSRKEVFIRDCMDAFLLHTGTMARAHKRGLIELEDLRDGLGYYVLRASEEIGDPLRTYMRVYNFADSLALFDQLLATVSTPAHYRREDRQSVLV